MGNEKSKLFEVYNILRDGVGQNITLHCRMNFGRTHIVETFSTYTIL